MNWRRWVQDRGLCCCCCCCLLLVARLALVRAGSACRPSANLATWGGGGGWGRGGVVQRQGGSYTSRLSLMRQMPLTQMGGKSQGENTAPLTGAPAHKEKQSNTLSSCMMSTKGHNHSQSTRDQPKPLVRLQQFDQQARPCMTTITAVHREHA